MYFSYIHPIIPLSHPSPLIHSLFKTSTSSAFPSLFWRYVSQWVALGLLKGAWGMGLVKRTWAPSQGLQHRRKCFSRCCHQLWMAYKSSRKGRATCAPPHYDRMLPGPFLKGLNHNYYECELKNIASMMWPEDSNSQTSYPAFRFYVLPTSFLHWCFLSLGGAEIDVPLGLSIWNLLIHITLTSSGSQPKGICISNQFSDDADVVGLGTSP